VVAVSGFVTDAGGRVLLVQPHGRDWEMPGGCVELGENLIEALQREIQEETGCQVHVDGLIGMHSRLTASEMVVLHFRCRYRSGEPTASAETPQVGWFTADEARRLVQTEPSRQRLQDALERRGSLIYRVYCEPYTVVRERAV
jgi:8-oxo-dGTP diphosphatase